MSTLADLFNHLSPITVNADNLDETWQLGRELGECLNDGMVICLWGDLGSGKTSFVQGLARGLGVPEDVYVTSPTYTLINAYDGRLPLYHLDLYRLGDSEELWDLGVDEILAERAVVAIEWPGTLPHELLSGHLRMDITISPDESRKFTFTPLGLDLKK